MQSFNNNVISKYHEFITSFLSDETLGLQIFSGDNFDPLSNKVFYIPLKHGDNLKDERVYIDLIIANLAFFDFELYFRYSNNLEDHKQSFYNFALIRIITIISSKYLGSKRNLEAYLEKINQRLFADPELAILKDFIKETGAKIANENYFYKTLFGILSNLTITPKKQEGVKKKTSKTIESDKKYLNHNKKELHAKEPHIRKESKIKQADCNIAAKFSSNNDDEKIYIPAEYKIYTKEYDSISRAEKLFADGEQKILWQELKSFFAEHKVSLSHDKIKLINSLKKQRSFKKKTEHGRINYAYLASIYTGNNLDRVFQKQTKYKAKDISCTILFDNSGSMHGRPIRYVVDFIYSFAQILDKEKIPYEILGFTTKSWKGGKSKIAWEKAKKPLNPGRLNDQRYVIYKTRYDNIVTAKKNLALVCKSGFLKENIDGEAIHWAYKRSLSFASKKNYLLYLSDGIPIDEATINNNNNVGILNDHLATTVKKIERKRGCKLLVTGPHVDTSINYQNFIPFTDYKDIKSNLIKRIHDCFKGSASN